MTRFDMKSNIRVKPDVNHLTTNLNFKGSASGNEKAFRIYRDILDRGITNSRDLSDSYIKSINSDLKPKRDREVYLR